MRVFVTGATGLIGSRVCRELAEAGHTVVALSRLPREGGGFEWVQGDAAKPGLWQQSVDGCDAVIHLSGEPIFDGRWSAARKRELVDSRVEGTRRVVEAIGSAKSPPGALVSGSAVGFYGPRGDELLREDAAPGDDFLAQLCVDWEAAAAEAQRYGVRVVCLRFGVVLSSRGGALARMLLPFRLGLGGPLGPSGRWFPWVHEDDAVGLTLFSLEAKWAGPVNVVAPDAVTMGEFSRALGSALRRPAFFPVPRGALRLVLGESADFLSPGQKVIPAVSQSVGYAFKRNTLADALAESVGRKKP
ncbi:MAG: TIGR01777 family oxidoreductase [Myxococcota bacterium]|nr:TIGR01777 family oxidoreductase [Myxococcota bacterium]